MLTEGPANNQADLTKCRCTRSYGCGQKRGRHLETFCLGSVVSFWNIWKTALCRLHNEWGKKRIVEKKKKLRKWKENTKSILRGWRQTPHHGQWAKRDLKIGSMRQGSPKESGKDTVFWKLVWPTTNKCAKTIVHFVGILLKAGM